MARRSAPREDLCWRKGTVRCGSSTRGQSIGDPNLADQVMAELTGIPTEGFFRSTASVRHFELSDMSRDEGALRDRLQASISGATAARAEHAKPDRSTL